VGLTVHISLIQWHFDEYDCDLTLQLLHAALKHNKFDTSEEEQLQMLDPFVSLLSDSLTSRHLKVLSRVCESWQYLL